MTVRQWEVSVPMYDSVTRRDREVIVSVALSIGGSVGDDVVRDALSTALRSALAFAASKYGILPTELSGREGPLEKDSRAALEDRLRDAGASVEAYQVLQAAVR